MSLLTEQVAVVTGAAEGIGRGIARMFVEEGAQVAPVDIDGASAEVVAATIEGVRPDPLATMHVIQACHPHMRDRDAAVAPHMPKSGPARRFCRRSSGYCPDCRRRQGPAAGCRIVPFAFG